MRDTGVRDTGVMGARVRGGMDEQHKGKGDMGEGQHDLIDTLRTFVMQIVSIIIIQFFFSVYFVVFILPFAFITLASSLQLIILPWAFPPFSQ